MKKIIIIVLIFTLVIGALSTINVADAAKKGGKKGGINAEEMEKITQTVDNFSKKIYANSLFSPKEITELIGVKIKLDDQMIVSPDPSLAPLYFKLGAVYKARDYKNEAIDCYQTILENFGDTAYAPKSRKALEDLGVVIKAPESEDSSEDGDEG